MSEPATLDASTAALEPVPDRRSERRLRSLLTGTIVFDNKCTMDCTVRNISAFGARVVLADAFRLPDTFNLRIPHHDQTHRARTDLAEGRCGGLCTLRRGGDAACAAPSPDPARIRSVCTARNSTHRCSDLLRGLGAQGPPSPVHGERVAVVNLHAES